MRIVFIGGRDIHKLGGIENYMYNLATQLVKMGHEPIVFCESDHDGEEWVNGFRVIHQKSLKSKFLCKIWLSLRATWKAVMKIRDVDIIHYNASGPGMGIFLARLLGQQHVMQGHGLEWERTKWTPRQRSVLKLYETTMYRLSRNIIMCSETQTRFYQKEFGLESVTIPTAVNLPDLSSDIRSELFDRFQIPRHKYFLFLARLVSDKNPHILIEAFKRARKNGYVLVIAGDNESDPGYVRKLHGLADGDGSVIFTGAVYGADKEALLRNAYAFCIPSTIEGLSISLLEAMSYRLPVIASDIPSNHEVLRQENALWCEPENIESLRIAIEQSIDKCEWFRNTGFENFSTVEDSYTWPKVTCKYIKHIETIVKK